MNPEAIARLRHALRTPLNHLIGYAEMVRDEAKDQGARAEMALMDQALSIARQIVDRVQQALPAKAHISDDALPELRTVMKPALERIGRILNDFNELTAGACDKEIRKMRAATRELLEFARSGGPAPTTEAPPAPEQPKHRQGPGGRILVVDDDADNREILARRLEREGFTAVTEASGASALERMSREAFDLVLLDIFMPEMDGFQVLERMKRQVELAEIPVIVLSALDDQANAVRSIEMGAEDFVAKPFDPVVLRARIGAILRRRTAEAERAEMAESLHLLLESTGEGVFGQDRNGRCAFVNRAAAEMLGYASDALLGRNLHSTVHHSRPDGSPYPPDACPMQSVLRTGEPRRGRDEVLFRADGTSFPIEFSANPIRREGRTEGLVVTFTDITERRRSEELLLQSAKLESVGVLAGGIAHDFNNILTAVLGNASLARIALDPTSPALESISQIEEASRRATDLCRQMLAYAGKGRFVLQRTNLNELIENTTHLLQVSISKKAVLRLNLDNRLPSIVADNTQIRQVLMNLVINASDAIGDRSGVISISTGVVRADRDYLDKTIQAPDIPTGDYVFVEVSDTGSGMTPEVQARIFEPFFTSKFTGRGLGLAAVSGIVHGHKGALKVYSEPGKGSSFKLLLPVAAQPTEVPAGPAEKEITIVPRGTILIVDDEETVQAVAARMLEALGFAVLLASDGLQALQIYAQKRDTITAVLMDLTMPHLDGEEAFRELRRMDPHVRVLLMSGYNEQDAIARFVGKGLAGFIQKPFNVNDLKESLRLLFG
jgi:PAS domain S-box-containing protein